MSELLEQAKRTEKDRQTLNEIFITAVIFGLTLNLISDLISSLPTLLLQSDFITLSWKLVCFVASLIATLLLLSRLSSYYLGDESRIERDFRISLIWETRGEPITSPLSTYRPRLVAKAIIDELDEKQIKGIDNVVKQGPKSLRESDYPLRFGEAILIKALADVSNVDIEQLNAKNISDVLADDNPIIRTLYNRSMRMWGKWNSCYNQIGNDESQIEIKWSRFPRSSMLFELKVGKVDWFEMKPDIHLAAYDSFYSHEVGEAFNEFWRDTMRVDPYGFAKTPEVTIPEKIPTGYIRSDIHLKVKTNFSALGLQRNWGNTSDLVKWAHYLINMIYRTLDWSFHLQHALQIHKIMFSEDSQG